MPALRHLLVRVPNWVGDAVMALPALQALHRTHGEVRLTILARAGVAPLFAREPFCHEVIAYTAEQGWRGIGSQMGMARQLRGGGFDAALLLPNAFEAAWIAWLARIPRRIGYNRDGRGMLLTEAVAVPACGSIPSHQRFYYLELLRRAGLVPSDAMNCEGVRMHDGASAARRGREWLGRLGVTLPVVGVAPGAAYGGAKRWLPERFAEAAQTVARERGASIAIFGAGGEAAVCGRVEELARGGNANVLNLGGKTTLSELIDALAACEMVLTNDSGPMHLASALGVATIAIFGATDDAATGPTGERARVIRHAVHCSPCLLRECPIDHRCMTGVSADVVAAEALQLTALPLGHSYEDSTGRRPG